MTLLITIFAAVTVTIIWYVSENARKLKLGMMCYMFWGASLMWLCDAVAEYISEGPEYFNQTGAEMLNDAFLGMSVIALALVIWIVILLIKDPKGVIRHKQL